MEKEIKLKGDDNLQGIQVPELLKREHPVAPVEGPVGQEVLAVENRFGDLNQ